MSKVTPSAEVSSLLQTMATDLATPIKKGEVQAIVKAVKQLPQEPTVTLGAMEQLGFSPAMRGNLVFEMFARQHPELVKPHMRSTAGFEGVFRAIAGQDPNDGGWNESAEIDEELARFAEALLEKDRENVNTGNETEGSIRALQQGELALGMVQDESLQVKAGKFQLLIMRESNDGITTWRYTWEKDKADPLAGLTLRSLEKLFELFSANAAEGAENPLLAMARTALNDREGDLLESATRQLESIINKKRTARAEHLAAVDECLRLALGDKAVGRASQDDVNQLAERALGSQG